MGNNPLLVFLIFLPLAGAAAVMLAGSRRPDLVRRLSLGVTLITLLLALGTVFAYRGHLLTDPRTGPIRVDPGLEWEAPWLTFQPHVSPGDAPAPPAAAVTFHVGVDGVALWLVALTALLMVSSVLVSWEAIQEDVAGFYALLLLLECGMLGVFCSLDLILFYVFFEFTLIPLFFLIGLWGGPDKRLAARKFFLYTFAGSLIGLVGLVGIVLTVNHSGQPLTFSIPKLAEYVATSPPADYRQPINLLIVKPKLETFLFLCLFCAFAIKVPLIPFHTWLPLAHVEAPTAGSVLLAGVLLKLGTFGFLRLALPLVPVAALETGMPWITFLAAVGILYGALCALAQDDVKKLVAYSSVSHLGFCMLGLFALNAEGLTGGVLEMVNHGLSTGALFLLVGMIYERYHTRQMGDYGGMMARLPRWGFFLVFVSMSSLGLPGLNGFVGELLSLMGMFEEPGYRGYAVLGTLGVILGAWYLLVMVQRMCFGPLKEPHHEGDAPVADLNRRELAALVPIAVLCVWIGVYPRPFISKFRPDVLALVEVRTRAQQELDRQAAQATGNTDPSKGSK
jgi:NADH-quinone oxidoreductase subunit M